MSAVERKQANCCGTWFGWTEVMMANGKRVGLLHYPDGFVLPFRGNAPF